MSLVIQAPSERRCASCLALPDTHHGNGFVVEESGAARWLCEPCAAAGSPSCTACGEPIWPGPQREASVALRSPSDELGTFHRGCLPPHLLRCAWETHRAYGGPEEGGWWYETGLLLAAVPVPVRAEPLSALAWVDTAALAEVDALLQRSFDALEDGPRGSGLKLSLECGMPELAYPAERPRFE